MLGSTEDAGLSLVTLMLVFACAALILLEICRRAFNVVGSGFFDKFSLFPFTIIGGVLVQLCAVRVKAESAINRRAVEGLGGLAMDRIVACAIGTLSLGAAA